ncbi:MAG: sugar ABC transporter ATP-binding protein [Peptoniphilaceae bacterium]
MNGILNLKSICKSYGGIKALDNVDISFIKGEIHSIVGENGAGKSTMIQIITGAVSPTSGEIYFNNEKINDMTPIKSKSMKIVAVYQELNLIPELSVYENIFYGREITKGLTLDEKDMKAKALNILKDLDSDIDINEKVKNLGIGSSQIVEIAKILIDEPNLILFDEPTASLPQKEGEKLHEIIKKLSNKGIAIVFVSHKLDEVVKISDTISVLRDGKLITSKKKTNMGEEFFNIPSLIRDMTGKSIDYEIDSKSVNEDRVRPILELKNISTSKISNVNLSLYKGEILSITGKLGSMRTELLSTIFGIEKIKTGEIYINGKAVSINNPKDAMKLGIVYITEDRKDSGLFMNLSIKENMTIVHINNKGLLNRIDDKEEEKAIEEILSKLDVKYSNINQKVKELSGGNQQKVVIGKWLITSPEIILLDEPTRGVDVGAKEEIYKIIYKLAKEGKAIIMVSSEIEEVLRLSHRTLVMSNGKIISEYDREDMVVENILNDSFALN